MLVNKRKVKKLIIITLFLSITPLISFSQNENENEINTIFKKPASNGGYGGISFGYTKINNEDTFISGIRGGWVIDHGLVLGLAGYGFGNGMNNMSGNTGEGGLAGGFGGLLIEPIIWPKSPAHVSFPVLIGAGGITWIEDYNYWEPYDNNVAAYFVFVPGAELELNIVNFFRIAIGVNYRFTPDIALYNRNGNLVVSPDVMRGFSANLILKFGKF